MTRAIRLCAVAALLLVAPWGLRAAEAGDPQPSARALASGLLREAAAARPARAELLRRLADGLDSGALNLAEVDRVLSIAGRIGALSQRPTAAPVPEEAPPEVDDATAQRAREMLEQLEGVPADAGAAAPERARKQPDPEAGGSEAEAVASGSILAVLQTKGEHPQTVAMIDLGSEDGLERGQRIQVRRDGERLVQIFLTDVKAEEAMGAVLHATWREDVERELRKGDAVALPKEEGER